MREYLSNIRAQIERKYAVGAVFFWASYGLVGFGAAIAVEMLVVRQSPELADTIGSPPIALFGLGLGIAVLQVGLSGYRVWSRAVPFLGILLGIASLVAYLYSYQYERTLAFHDWPPPYAVNSAIVAVALLTGAFINGRMVASLDPDSIDFIETARSQNAPTRKSVAKAIEAEEGP